MYNEIYKYIDSMKTIKKPIQCEINIKKSQFICSLFPTKNKKESKEIIQKISSQYNDATHNCTAYIVNDVEGFDDDGEPGGTAGRPMINVLRKNELHNITAIVTRYFGGIKLGAGGLVRAYSGAVANAADAAGLAQKVKMGLYVFSCAPGEAGRITNLLYQQQLFNLADTEYGNAVIFTLRMPEDRKITAEKWLTDTLQKPIELTEAGFEYEEVPV